MTARERKGWDLYYRKNPGEALSTPEDIKRLTELINSGCDKLSIILSEKGGRVFTPQAAHQVLLLAERYLKNQNIEAEFLAMNDIISKWAERSIQNAIQFYKNLILGACLGNKPNEQETTPMSVVLADFFVMQHSPRYLQHEAVRPTKTTSLLYEAADNGILEAMHILHYVWWIMNFYETAPEPYRSDSPLNKDTIYWLMPKGAAKFFEWYEKYNANILKDDKTTQLVKKAKAKMRSVIQLINELWDEIEHFSRRDIRPEEKDVFCVAGGPSESHVHPIRYFLRQDTEFPNVNIAIAINFFGKNLWLVANLTSESIRQIKNLEIYDIVLTLAYVIAYHKILCAEAKEVGKENQTENIDCEAIIEVPQIVRTTVREHTRRLPEGKKISPKKAEDFYEKYHREIEDGMTLVRSHEREFARNPYPVKVSAGIPRPHFSVNIKAIIDNL